MASGTEQPGDAELVRAVIRGQREAYGTLVDRHLPSVYAVVLRIVGNRADAEDVAQDVFVRALQKLDQFASEFSFRNWLLKIATHLAINHLRSRKRERLRYPRIVEQQEQKAEDAAAAELGPCGEIEVKDWQPLLAQLREQERAAITLFHFQGMSYVQVAQTLELPLNSVRVHLHRGRKKLRELLMARRRPESGSWTVAI